MKIKLAVVAVLLGVSPALGQGPHHGGYWLSPGLAEKHYPGGAMGQYNDYTRQKLEVHAPVPNYAVPNYAPAPQAAPTANDRRESAYKASKAAHRAKVKKMKKASGQKPHNSWQLK